MDEVKIAVGNEVRVHFHPPGATRSYCEGVVSRVDVTTQEGRFFVVEVQHEVLLDREHRIGRGFPDYVRYECRNDFPGRIEVLSAASDTEQGPALDHILIDAPVVSKLEASEPPPGSTETSAQTGVEQVPEAQTSSDPTWDEVERRSDRKQIGLIATLFGRKER